MGTPGLVVAGSCSAEGVRDGDNGFISADESPEAIAQAIIRALPCAGQAGMRARDTIPVSWASIMAKVTAEYDRLILQKREARRGRGEA